MSAQPQTAPAPPGTGQTYAPPQQPGQQQLQPGEQPQGRGAPTRTRSSAERVLWISIVSTAMALIVAVAGFVLAQNQAAMTAGAGSGADRVLTVMAVRNAILTADGAATNAFLVGGLEPQDRRAVYDEAIAQASVLLTELAEGADDDAELIAGLNTDLATYTSLVEAARVNNRQGFPVGAAYLDQASTLVREQMLPDLDVVLRGAADDAADSFNAGNRATVALVVIGLALLVLLVVQAQLARISRRRVNGGLALATVLLIVALLGGGLTAWRAAETTAEVRTDSYRPTLAVAQAASLAAEARTLESFTLIKRGSGQAYETDFIERTDEARELLGDEPDLQTALVRWLTRHSEIRDADDSGDWDGAVELAVTDETASSSVAFQEFAQAASDRVEEGAAQVTDDLDDAAAGARLGSWVMAGAGLLAASACWLGTRARREEYR